MRLVHSMQKHALLRIINKKLGVFTLLPFTRRNCDSINFTCCLWNAASKANFGIFKDPECVLSCWNFDQKSLIRPQKLQHWLASSAVIKGVLGSFTQHTPILLIAAQKRLCCICATSVRQKQTNASQRKSHGTHYLLGSLLWLIECNGRVREFYFFIHFKDAFCLVCYVHAHAAINKSPFPSAAQ